MSIRDRACVAVLDSTETKILMVRHRHQGREYWTLPGGGLEDRETFAEAALREVKEETGVDVELGEAIFDELYDHEGSPALSRCFWGTLKGSPELRLGAGKRLQEVSWCALGGLADHVQVSRVLGFLRGAVNPREADQDSKYFRVHTADLAFAAQKPTACRYLVQAEPSRTADV